MSLTSKALSLAYRRSTIAAAMLALLVLAVLASGGRDAQPGPSHAAGANAEPGMTGNWNFERGNLTGWHTRSRGSGSWYAYSDGTKPPNLAESDPDVPFDVPQPPEGCYAAVTDMTAPGARILYRDVKLDGATKLKFTLYYDSASEFSSTANLEFAGREANQQFRVEVMDPAAPADSTAPKHILACFRPRPAIRRSSLRE